MSQQKHSLDKDKIKIVLFEGIHKHAVSYFNDHGYTNVELLDEALTGQDLIAKVQDAHMIGVRSRTQVRREVIESATKLMAIGCFCIGTNQVDLDDAALQGIPVFNAPHSNTRSVAELVIGQTIMLMRGTFAKSMAAHRQEWRKSAREAYEVRGKTIGIIGYGHIGSQVSVLAEAMGMKVVYYDIVPKLPLGNATQMKTMDELLITADVVTLHVPEDRSTRNMMSREKINLMKKGAHLINASRGTVVEIDALVDALKARQLSGAAVDVFPVEPKSNELPFTSPLIGLENVILTPHIGGSTIEAQENIGHEVAGKLVSFSDTGASIGAVNFPQVSLPVHPDGHRVLHIHRNVPGILRQINRVLADEDINVVGQYLATDSQIGYVVLDIEKDMSKHALDLIRETEGTIRVRRLF